MLSGPRLLCLLPLGWVMPASAAPAPLRAVAECAAPLARSFAFTQGGVVERLASNRRSICRLTPPIDASEPAKSPDGAWVAFLTGPRRNDVSNNTVRILRVGSPFSRGTRIAEGSGINQSQLTWAPNGRALAFASLRSVYLWRAACRCSRTVYTGTTAGTQTFAWSLDSRYLAFFGSAFDASPGVSITVVVRKIDVVSGARHAVTVRFPRWLAGSKPYSGSYPTGIVAVLPGNSLLLHTSGWGAGLAWTGLWTAPAGGGMAYLAVGTRALSSRYRRGGLLDASQVVVSPDGRRMLFDPVPDFWIASTSGAVLARYHLPSPGCLVTQARWVGNSAIVYVADCGGGLQRMSLLSLAHGAVHTIREIRSPWRAALSIGPATRCRGCGAG